MTEPISDRDIERTASWMAEARRILAYGGFDGVVRRPLFADDGTPFPQFAADAAGCEIVDTLGRRYVDWVNGWGPVLLGYRRPEIEAAVREQMAVGPTLSLMHPIEIEVARELTQMVPCAEMVAFGKNGSDAVTAAVRVARAATGRNLILHYGMHGFHDWYLCVHPQVRGLPSGLREQIAEFPYGDLSALEKLFTRNKGRVAGVVMEPVREILPRSGYLEAVRDLTHRHGALLIWDEVVTALRLAPGGAQEYFGVAPDLACLGKSLGNGMPLSALVGRRAAMQHLPAVGFGMTFRGETYSLAAARAVLRFVRENDVAGALARTGESVRRGIDLAARERGLTSYASGLPHRLTLVFRDEDGLPHETQRELFVQECMKHGVLTNGNFLPSYAHDAAAVARSLAAIERALDALAAACRARSARGLDPAGGFPSGPRASIAYGFLESLAEDVDGLRLGGWLLLEGGAPDSIALTARGGERIVAQRVVRDDLVAAYPRFANAAGGGFAATLPAKAFTHENAYDFRIEALVKERVAFTIRAVLRLGAGGAVAAPPFSLSDGVLYV